MRFSDVSIGDALPTLAVPVTASLIVGGAIASRDFTPVHHDVNAAKAGGMPDIFMNILTSNGLMGRFVTDWAGHDCTLKAIDIKLGAPNIPGCTMTITGSVLALDAQAHTVEVKVNGENDSWGMHMLGTVRVQLPR